LGGYYRHGKYQVGLKTSYTHLEKDENKKLQVNLGTIVKLNDKSSVKAKVDKDANVSVGFKHACCKNLSVALSTGINLKDPHSFVKNTIVPIPFGVQFEFSY